MASIYAQQCGRPDQMIAKSDRDNMVEICRKIAWHICRNGGQTFYVRKQPEFDGGFSVLYRAKGQTMVSGHVWPEPSAQHLADQALPEWLMAPAGAPDNPKPRKVGA